MENLILSYLPDLPQCATLKEIAGHLWGNDEIVALWVEGSLARGTGDLFSDVDLHVVVTPEQLTHWKNPDFTRIFATAPVVGKLFLPFGEHAFLHHLLLSNGHIFDFFVQDIDQPLSIDTKLILGCRNTDLARSLQEEVRTLPAPVTGQPVQKERLQQMLESFWISTFKHGKVLYRGLTAMTLLGLTAERNILLRLWYIQATGEDCGDLGRSTIHSLTHVIRVVELHMGPRALELLGAPLRNRDEIYRTIDDNRNEVATLGRQLAQQYEFAYPAALETMVRHHWQQLPARESK